MKTKSIRLLITLEYPACDIYSRDEFEEFLSESFQDYINANMSDGDDRLKLTDVQVEE